MYKYGCKAEGICVKVISEKKREMEGSSSSAERELEIRTKYLNSLLRGKKKSSNHGHGPSNGNNDEKIIMIDEKTIKNVNKIMRNDPFNIRVRGSDMDPALQQKAFKCAAKFLDSMPPYSKLDTKSLAFSLKKEFDTSFGPAWHCIVGTSFGSYVTHTCGGFVYFSIDHIHILLFKTAIHPYSL